MSERPAKEGGARRRIGGYELVRRLGRGSMGAVFLARQISLDRQVALKILTPRLAKNENYVRRFVREAKSAAKLNHPNIVTAIDVGQEGNYKYFVMEYAEGPTVSQLLARGGALAPERALTILLPVVKALDHAHQSGFVHRDIKPANIILTKDGAAKLCDLGLAKEVEEPGSDTQEGQALGTPDYISPEQARGEAGIDIRSDIYSLGATLYHMLTGEVPFKGKTPAVIMTKHITEELLDPRLVGPPIGAPLAQAVMRMMAKAREDRFQTPEELHNALVATTTAVDEVEVQRKPLPNLKSRRSRGRRRRRF